MSSTQEEKSVFINCPFDDDYKPLFDAIVFAIFDCGFVARCSLQSVDGAIHRLQKIFKLISICPYSIHDISRTELNPENNLPRFNMPFELGLYLGAREFGDGQQKKTSCLILDTEEYRYQKYLSDIAGQDIDAHDKKPELAIKAVRTYLSAIPGTKSMPGGVDIWKAYQKFKAELPTICANAKLEEEELEFNDFCDLTTAWLEGNSR